MKSKKIVGAGIVFILIIAVIFTIFILPSLKSNENEDKIKAIIEQIFTCPDREMITLFEDELKKIRDSSTTPGTIVGLDFIEIEKKLKEMYGPYISEPWFDSFVQHYFNEFMIYSTVAQYEMKVTNIEFVQSKTIPTNYSFTVSLNYGPAEGEKKDIKIDGSAQISEDDDKVSFIQLFTSNEFKLEFREKVNE
ncbi:MAG: hypothetical protein K0R21_1535 [Anaerocolumna sp.]|jgi:hypothetical protein|nr:hypothetical protein [Anaerocolumna sp.]